MRKRDTTPERRRACFIAPMLLQRSAKLPEDDAWLIELKLDGFRAIAFKTGGKVHLRSRNDKDFNGRYPAIVKALSNMPDETVLDGEIVALDESGRPSFNVLQNYGSSDAPIFYYVFDLPVLAGRDARRLLLRWRSRSAFSRRCNRGGMKLIDYAGSKWIALVTNLNWPGGVFFNRFSAAVE
jgi:ATP-dependent DNA ligase